MQRPYFVLSYAHSAPLASVPGANPDELVGKFFGDLAKAVERLGSLAPGTAPGFYDQEIPLGSDWKASFSRALGAAQVFVPLYSTAYIDRERPGQEWACFERRVELAGLENPRLRFLPVLWAPLSEGQHPDGLEEALALGRGERGYTQNGLWPLLKIGEPFARAYRSVVNSAARRIVELAEESPIMPSEVPDIDDMESPFATEHHLSVFVIETAAPTVSTVSSERSSRGYGESSSEWRPFSHQELPLATYAEQVARRLDFKPEARDIRTVSDPRDRRPGIILIDPWFIADVSGRMALASAVENLPRWVLPLVIVDHPGDASTQKLADEVNEILSAAGALPTELSRRAARGVSSLDEFVSTVPVLVADAERQYLRYRGRKSQSGTVTSPRSGSRPSLRGPARPDGIVSEPDKTASSRDRWGDTPDD